jgi:FtsH-binding integral membrane protein
MNDPSNSGSKGYKQLSSDASSIENDFMYNSNVAQASTSIRLAFLRKVYGILGLQLLITTVIGSIIMASSGIKDFLNEKYVSC